MPKLWSETIEAHRREVRAAIMDTTARLAAEDGLLNVTMSQVAEETGIGRATLYKYFAGVEAILRAWHQRQVSRHLEHLTEIADRDGSPLERLTAVLEAYARIQRHRTDHGSGQHADELAAYLHRDPELSTAHRQLRDLLRTLLVDAATHGQVRSDVSADELTTYCLHALGAASTLPSDAAIKRLVGLIRDALDS